ncbi:hypothetical protein WH50_08850 [Pokkaliibacter plantistimulans]|uniref:YCII-related domain-containing protein n=1 Tax=Pokkaliibacter plantistimulans TaxID=1635171 RepID=A0ABX5M1Q3_9GAMM|nr:hypothetical protein [Pokkaliibacter plantistimulans]PXF31608.1 hypothetical protein WH50_08850 [Pokkaliibacter plantistimulans]
MIFLLCRNRVTDFYQWKSVFDTMSTERRHAGMHLLNLWRTVDEPNNVFFLLRLDDVEKARSLLSDPDYIRMGWDAGVIDGDYTYLEDEKDMGSELDAA